MNPLPNRPLLSNSNLPLTLPNVPSFDQMAYNGRPRKVVPEAGKDFPMSLMGVPTSMPPASGSGSQLAPFDRDSRANAGVPLHPAHPSQQQQPGGGAPQMSVNNFLAYQQQSQQQQPSVLSQAQSLQLQTAQLAKDAGRDPLPSDGSLGEPQQLTAIFRPDSAGEWKERLERARAEKYGLGVGGQMGASAGTGQQVSGVSAWEAPGKDEEEEGKEEEVDMEDDETASTSSEEDGKIWRARRTLRKYAIIYCPVAKESLTDVLHSHLDAVRALAFHPTEMCLATGGDDCTVKIWRMDVGGLASSA